MSILDVEPDEFNRWREYANWTDLAAIERIHAFPDTLILWNHKFKEQWPELEAVVGQKIPQLPYRVNESRDKKWREKYL